MSRDTDRTEALRRELVGAIVADTGVREVLAMPYANSVLAYLQREYAGERVYIPAPPRQYDVLQIDAELRAGESPAKVARHHGTTIRQLHRMFPGGLPKATSQVA